MNHLVVLGLLSLLILIPAVFQPTLHLSFYSLDAQSSVVGTIKQMLFTKQPFVAVVVFITTIGSAVLHSILLILIAIQFHFKHYSRLRQNLILYTHVSQWIMIEVYFVGILLAAIKLKTLAHFTFEDGILFLAGYAGLFLYISQYLKNHSLWVKYRECVRPKLAKKSFENEYVCERCSEIYDSTMKKCPICQQTPSTSTQPAWVWICIAVICLVPANCLPMLTTVKLHTQVSATIFEGVLKFFRDGDKFLACVIFAASIMIPILKLGILSWLLCYTPSRMRISPTAAKRFLKLVHWIGRWSMLDIYVVVIVCESAQLGAFTDALTSLAATYFASAVFATIIAAKAFNSRLLWKHV